MHLTSQKNMGCEDYAATYDDEKVSIAVISDGHGDKNALEVRKGTHSLRCFY